VAVAVKVSYGTRRRAVWYVYIDISQDPAAPSETSVLFSIPNRVMLERSSLRGNFLDEGTSDNEIDRRRGADKPIIVRSVC